MYYAHQLTDEVAKKIKELPRDTELSFDGVHKSVYERFDLIVGRPVTLFVIGGFANIYDLLNNDWSFKISSRESPIGWKDPHPSYCSVEQLLWMKSMGCKLGWHTMRHGTSIMEDDLIFPAHFDPIFAYPFGIYDDTAKQMVKDAGFALAYATENGTTDPYSIKRLPL